jgi:branched-chain amino acid transport system ATP-binding protein
MGRLLELTELSVSYGRTRAVQGVSLHVDEGEAVGLIGPNGAGKTSTLSAIAGLVAPVAGEVRLGGRSIAGSSPEARVRLGLALVPEGRQVFSTLTVEENLRIATFAGRSDSDAIERELERFPALRPCLARHAGSLSGGEQQQLAIARALLCSPRVLLLDEPSLGLAPRVVDTVFETLARLRDDGVTILLVEQNAARAVAFAERSYVLNAGRVDLEGTRDELRADARLEAAYLGGGPR